MQKSQQPSLFVLPIEILLVVFRFLPSSNLVSVAKVCKHLRDTVCKSNTLWSTVDLSDGTDEELLKAIVINFGKHIHTLYISDTENINKSCIEISQLNKAITMCTALQRLIITHINYGKFDFWTPITEKCPNLSWIEVRSCNDSNSHIVIANFLLQKYPNIEHLTLVYMDNFLHTQRTLEGIKSVITLIEKEFEHEAPGSSKWVQFWITLQFLYKKIGDKISAKIVLDKALAHYTYNYDAKILLEMDERLLSGKCSRPLDTRTCYYWNLCFTCGLNGFSGLCAHCANTCHKGHRTIFKYVSSGAYCDCSTHSRYHILQ